MTSDEDSMPSKSCTTMVKAKRHRRAPLISMAATQSCIAASMAKVIGSMVNPIVQYQCMHMLQVDNIDQVQGKILDLLQQIDFDILEEQEKKDKAKKARAKKKSMVQQKNK